METCQLSEAPLTSVTPTGQSPTVSALQGGVVEPHFQHSVNKGYICLETSGDTMVCCSVSVLILTVPTETFSKALRILVPHLPVLW